MHEYEHKQARTSAHQFIIIVMYLYVLTQYRFSYFEKSASTYSKSFVNLLFPALVELSSCHVCACTVLTGAMCGKCVLTMACCFMFSHDVSSGVECRDNTLSLTMLCFCVSKRR